MSLHRENWGAWGRPLASLASLTLFACATTPLPAVPANTMAAASLGSPVGPSEPALPQAAAQPRVILPAPPLDPADASSAQAPAPFTPTDSPLFAYYDGLPHGSQAPSQSAAPTAAQDDAPGYRSADAAYSGVGVGLSLGLLGLGIGLGFGMPYYPYRYGYYGGGYYGGGYYGGGYYGGGYGHGHYGHGGYGHGGYGHGGGYHGRHH